MGGEMKIKKRMANKLKRGAKKKFKSNIKPNKQILPQVKWILNYVLCVVNETMRTKKKNLG